MDLPEMDRGRLGWWLVGVVLAGVVSLVAYTFVGTLVVGLFVYYAARPVYRRLPNRKQSPSLAAALALFVLVLPLLLLVGYAFTVGLRELRQVAGETNQVELGVFEQPLAVYRDAVTATDTNLTALLSDPNAVATLRRVSTTALDYAGVVGIGLLHLFVMLAVAFYLLRDGPRLARWTLRRVGDEAGVLEGYARAVDRDLSRVFSGNILNAVATAGIGAVVYSGVNVVASVGPAVPYPALLGVLAGAASLVPVVGVKLVYVPVSAYLFAVAYTGPDPVYTVPVSFALLSFVVVDTIPDLVLRPYVAGRSLHVGLVMFAYIFGPLLFGWYGLFLGPLLLVLLFHFGRLVLPELADGTEIEPFAVDPATVDPATERAPASDATESGASAVESESDTDTGADEKATDVPPSYG